MRSHPPSRSPRSDLWPPALVAALAAALRLAYLAVVRESPLFGFFPADQGYYRDWGRSLAAGGWVSPGVFEQGPLYAWLLGGLYRVLGPSDLRVLSVQLLAGVATALLVWACGRRVFGGRAALLSGLLAAAYGPLIFHEGLLMKTWLEPLLTMAALFAALRFRDGGRVRWLAASAAGVGLACLVREIHALLLLPLLVEGWRTGRRAGAIGAAALAFLLAVAPATVRNCVTAGECVPVTSGGGEVAYLAFGASASAYYSTPPFIRPAARIEHQDFRDEARLRTGRRLSRREASDYWFREALQTVRDAPLRTLGLLARRARGLCNDYEFPDNENFATARRFTPLLRWLPSFGWVLGLGVLGIAWSLRSPAPAFLPLSFLAVVALQVLLSYALGRFRLALAPLLLLFAGHALERLAQLAASGTTRDRRRLVGAACVAGLASASAYLPPPVAADDRWILRADEDYRSQAAARLVQRVRIGDLEAHLATRPDDAAAWGALGEALEKDGRNFEAEQAQTTALRLEPGSPAAHWALAGLCYAQGRFDRAAQHARDYVRAKPDDGRGHTGLGVYCSRLADETRAAAAADALRQEAAAHFAEARRLDPVNAEVWFFSGKYLALAGSWQEAAALLTRAIELSPGHTEARRVLGLVRMNLNRAPRQN